MPDLSQLKCVPCRGGIPPLTDAEIAPLASQVPKWRVIEVNGVKRLERAIKFKDFVDALEFTVQVGELAGQEGHHPLLVTEWGRVRVQWWTHKIKGLHQNDFIMAAKTDKLVS